MSAGMSRGLPTGSATRRSTALPTAWDNSIGADAIERGTVESALADAAAASGLVADDGEEAVRRTIKSGLDAGAGAAARHP